MSALAVCRACGGVVAVRGLILALALLIAIPSRAEADTALDEYNTAVGLYKQERWKLAATQFRTFLKTNDKHEKAPLAKLYLGLTLVNLDDFTAAREELRGFVKENPQNANLAQARYRIAECSYLLNDLAVARTDLDSYLKDFPKDPFHDHALPYLADVQLRLNDPAAALALFQQAVDRYPTGPLVEDAKFGRFKRGNVRLLLDDQATTREIKEGLNWLARSAQPDDLVVVFLSSHGSPRELDLVGVNYIVTSDTIVGDPEKDPDSLFATALPMVDLSDIVRGRIQSRRTVILLDTCHSGGATGSSAQEGTGLGDSSASSQALDRIRQGVGRVILTSSTEKERSWESQAFHNGYFTYYLIRALKQDEGLAPIDKVYAYVRDNVSQRVSAEVRAHQTPVLSRSDSGAEIVIGAPSAGTSTLLIPPTSNR